jgi:hypothetical protein
MHRIVYISILWCAVAAQAFCELGGSLPDESPMHGTINVIVANDRGIVVLTDSMLTQTREDAHHIRTSLQLPTPGQKLFQIDDRTVCAFAGFASASTPPLPEFLNSVSAIIARFKERIRNPTELSVSDKLQLLEAIFNAYITAIAGIREDDGAENYRFEFSLAGYDPDGTPEIGRLVLSAAPEQATAGPLLRSTTQQRVVFPVGHHQMICINGISDVALGILRKTGTWRTDPEGTCELSTSGQKLLSLEEMKAFAISLKERTADRYPEVGGPNQIAVLADSRLQSPIEQPTFLPVKFPAYSFAIMSNSRFGPSDGKGRPTGDGIIAPMLFKVYFRDEFVHSLQAIDNTYYGGNVFKDCILTYGGGRVLFAPSNQVIDSDLEIDAGVSPDSPRVRQLVHDFKWRSVKYAASAAGAR